MKWFAGPLAGVLVALGGGTTPTLARADELVLKPSRDLAPPAPKTETMPAAPARPGQPRPARTPKTAAAPPAKSNSLDPIDTMWPTPATRRASRPIATGT